MLRTVRYSREKDRPQMARIWFPLSLSRKIGWNIRRRACRARLG